MNYPKRIFFTGAPGSRWSGIAQLIESMDGFNTTDRWNHREYKHSGFSGHRGAYFGEGMEFEANCSFTDKAYTSPDAGCMIVKSHEWALDLKGTRIYGCDSWQSDNAWMMLVYRPNDACMEWWQQAGGFDITYPDYKWYEDNARMQYMIRNQNENMLAFAAEHKLKWSAFNDGWVSETFEQQIVEPIPEWNDVLVTMYKPNV